MKMARVGWVLLLLGALLLLAGDALVSGSLSGFLSPGSFVPLSGTPTWAHDWSDLMAGCGRLRSAIAART